LPVRFRILALLFGLSFVNYLVRNNISVVLPSIRAEFSLSGEQLGWILGSFNLAYALFQIPGGMFGDWLGARRALTVCAIVWGVLTFMTGFAPHLMVASVTGAIVSLSVVRFLMGVSHAPIFTVAAASIARWFPPGGWALPNSILNTGLTLGQAAVGPLVTFLIIKFGWRESFYALTPLAFITAAWWWWYARDAPAEHPAVTPAERVYIEAGRAAPTGAPSLAEFIAVLRNRNVLLLAGAYFCMNYVFYMFAQWLFSYLVEERGFSMLESGLMYALPFLAGAVLALAGGFTCDALCRRLGATLGCRLPALAGLLLVAVFLLAGIYSFNHYVAVAFLSLCFGFTQFTEGAFWSACTFASGSHTATATGVMNTGGNLAGVLAPVVGIMVDRLGWLPTLASGSLFALAAIVLWFFVRLDGRALGESYER
jgi:ACS family glucarate transporter-like MFS transporter